MRQLKVQVREGFSGYSSYLIYITKYPNVLPSIFLCSWDEVGTMQLCLWPQGGSGFIPLIPGMSCMSNAWQLLDLLLIGSATNRKAFLGMGKKRLRHRNSSSEKRRFWNCYKPHQDRYQMENMLECAIIVLWLQLGCKLEVQRWEP